MSHTSDDPAGERALLACVRIHRQVFKSCLAWCLLPPGYVFLAVGGHLPTALAGTFLVGFGAAAAFVLVTSATQQSVDDGVLDRAVGIVFLGNLGAKPVGLFVIAPLYVFFHPSVTFLAGAVVLLAAAPVAAGDVDLATRRYVAVRRNVQDPLSGRQRALAPRRPRRRLPAAQ